MIGDDFTNTPPAHALARRGITHNVVGFPVYGDYSQPSPLARHRRRGGSRRGGRRHRLGARRRILRASQPARPGVTAVVAGARSRGIAVRRSTSPWRCAAAMRRGARRSTSSCRAAAPTWMRFWKSYGVPRVREWLEPCAADKTVRRGSPHWPVAASLAAGCEREARRYQELPASANRETGVRVSGLEPGTPQQQARSRVPIRTTRGEWAKASGSTPRTTARPATA